MSRVLSILAMLMLLVGCYTLPASGQEREAAPNPPPVPTGTTSFRWVRVPEADLPQTARGHIALERDKFFEYLNQLQESRSGLPRQRVEIRTARYTARWSHGQLVGDAVLDLVLHGDGPQFLSLSEFAVGMESVSWGSRPDAPVTVQATTDGNWGIQVEQSDQLNIRWSFTTQATQTAEHGEYEEVRLQLPRASLSRLQLELPADRRLSASPLIVARVPVGEQVDTSPHTVPEVDANAGPDGGPWHQWVVELGGSTMVQLRSYAEGEIERAPLAGALRLQSTYEVRQQGVTVTWDAVCELRDRSMHQLEFELPERLQVVHVESAEVQGEWSIVSEDDTQVSYLRFVSGEPFGQAIIKLRITALTDVPLVGAIRFPQLHSRDLVWREGTAVVRVLEPLSIRVWNIHGGRDAGVKRLADKMPGEQRDAQYFAETGEIELQVEMNEPRATVASGWRISVGGPRMLAQGTIDYRQDGNAAFMIACDVPLPWQVDDVTCDETDRLERWEVVAQDAEKSRVELLLSPPLRPGETLRCRFEFSRTGMATGTVMRDADFQPVRFSAVVSEKRLVTVDSTSGHVLRSEGNAFTPWLSSDQLTPDERDRVPSLGRWTYRAELTGDDVTLLLTPGKREFTANTAISAVFDNKVMLWRADIRLSRSAAVPDRFVVNFTNRWSESPSFSLQSPRSDTIMARKLTVEEEERWGLESGGESWELTGLRGPEEELVVHVEQTTTTIARDEPTSVPLVYLPQATVQSGVVELYSTELQAPVVKVAAGLQTLPTSVGDALRSDDHLIATYLYNESPPPGDHNFGPLHIRFPEIGGPMPVWVSTMKTRTRFLANGHARYQTEMVVQNRGANNITVSLPVNARVHRALVDGSPVSVRDEQQLTIDLPSRAAETRLAVEYSTKDRPWDSFVTLSPALMRVNVPVLEHLWMVDQPTNYEAWQASTGYAGNSPLATIEGIGSRHNSGIYGSHWFDRFVGSRRPDPGGTETGSVARRLEQSDYRFVLRPQSANCSVDFYHRPTMALVAWGLGLATLATTSFWLSWSGRRYFVLAMLIACLVLLTPTPFHLIFVGPFWGLLIAVSLRAYALPLPARTGVSPWSQPGVRRVAARDGSSWGTPSIIGWVAFGLLLGDSTSCAQDASELKADSAARGSEVRDDTHPSYRVIVPVDGDEAPVGNYVYPEEAFFHWLREETQRLSADGRPWWIEGTKIVCRLQRDQTDGQPIVAECAISMDVRTRKPETLIELPPAINWRLAARTGAFVDGREATVIRGDNERLTLLLSTPGAHHLQWSIEVAVSDFGNRRGFDLPITPHPKTELELLLPNGLEVEIPTSKGTIRRSAMGNAMTGFLGPVPALQVRWIASNAGTMVPEAASRARRYTRLGVRPGAVTIDVRWDFDWGEDAVTQLRWVTDGRLKVLPPPPFIGELEVRDVGDGKQEIILHLARPWNGERSLTMTFLAPYMSGVGAVTIPDISLLAPVDVTHWLALDVASSLSYRIEGASYVAIARNDFVGAWGENVKVDFACEIDNDQELPTVHTEVLEPRCQATQRVDLTYGPQGCAWQATFDIDPLRGEFYQYSFELPAGGRLRHAFLESQETRRRLRVASATDRLVTLFLPNGQAARHRIVLTGDVTVSPGMSTAIPHIRLVDAEEGSTALQVYRDPRVAVTLAMPAEWNEWLDPAYPQVNSDGERRAGGYQWPDVMAAPGTITMHANRPTVVGTTITTLESAGGEWWGELECHIVPSGGTCDRIVVELADLFDPAATFTPAERVESRSLPEGRRSTTIYLSQPTAEPVVVRMRAKLTSPPATRFPLAEITNANESVAYIRLPERDDKGPLFWNTRGLREISPGSDHTDVRGTAPTDSAILPPSVDRTPGALLYQVVDEFPRLEVRQTNGTGTPARIPFWQADCRLSDAGSSGHILFYVISGTSDGILVRVESGCRLVHATVDGTWIVPTAVNSSLWRLPVGETGYPRRVEVTFQMPPLSIGRHATRWYPVASVDVEPELAVWTIHCPATCDVKGSGKRIAAEVVKREQWIAEVSMLSQAIGSPDTLRIPELERWAWQWMERLHRDRELLLADGETGSDLRWDAAEGQWLALCELQALVDPINAAFLSESPVGLGRESAPVVGEPNVMTVAFVNQRGNQVWNGLEITGPDAFPENDRLLATGVLGAITCLLAVALASRRLQTVWRRAGHLLWTMAGTGWVWQMTPSWPGWVAIAFGIIATLLVNWPTARRRPSRSSFVATP